MRRCVLLMMVVCGFTASMASAQSGTTEDVHLEADSVSFRRVDGREVADMIMARLRQGNTRLTADRAQDEGNGYVQFWGNVVIVEEADTVRADRVRYHKDTKIGEADGNVFLTDGSVVLTAPSARYHAAVKQTFFEAGVRFADSVTVLTAGRGRYDSGLERADFAVEVLLEREETMVWADSVAFLRPSDEAWAIGLVAAVTRDSTGAESARMFGDRLYRAERSDSLHIEGNVLLARFDAETTDTLLVAAQRASVVGDRLTAQDSVVVVTGSSALRGDSLVVRDEGAESHLFGGVAAWLEATQVAADSLTIQEHGGGVDSVHAYGGVFVARKDSSTGRINQMRARALHAQIVEESLRSMRLAPNAETLLYVFQETSQRTIAFTVSSDAVRLLFTDGEPTRIAYTGQTSGTEYTENLFDRLSDLRGYIWTPGRRPERARLRDRLDGLSMDRIRTSER